MTHTPQTTAIYNVLVNSRLAFASKPNEAGQSNIVLASQILAQLDGIIAEEGKGKPVADKLHAAIVEAVKLIEKALIEAGQPEAV